MHTILPNLPLEPGFLHPEHQHFLKEWREYAVQKADDGDVASSVCLQGAFIDLVQNGRLVHDWLGVLDAFLLEDDLPLAYSAKFGKRLYGFDNQYKQVTIHAVHTRWWIECLSKGEGGVDHAKYANLILSKKRAAVGLIYDHDISPTTLRHRMKTELTMSMALAVELLIAGKLLTDDLSSQLAINLVDPKKCPPTGYMSTEYYRLHALSLLGFLDLFPVKIETAIDSCATGLDVGYCDFSMNSKFDAYMGTAKRIGRDKPIHSPLTARHVGALTAVVGNSESRKNIGARLNQYACHLKDNPMDIPAFQMRDVPIPFGAGKTPIEVICASYLISQCTK